MASPLGQKTCSACFKQNDDVRACSQCNSVAYCSKKCQIDDWKAIHKKKCKVLALQHAENKTKELPDMTSMDSAHGVKICKVCLDRTDRVQLCTGCKQVAYCSKDCQMKDWQRGHKDNCGEGDASSEDFSDTRCWFCQKSPNKIKTCQGCLSAYYCDAVCQKSDWKEHKAKCKQIQAANSDCVASLFWSSTFGGVARPSSSFIGVTRPNESCYEKVKRAASRSFPKYKVVENFETVPFEPFFEFPQIMDEYVVLAFIPRWHPYDNRHSVYLSDINGIESYAAFYVSRQDSPSVCKDVNPGNFICIPNARFHQFLDGSTGFRINDQNDFRIIKPSDYNA